MDGCIFCKIVSGEIPSLKIYETDKCIAVLDINPANPGHILIISKKHFENIYDIDDDVLEDMILVAKKMSIRLKKRFECLGVNILMNNEKIAGQMISHAHIHVIPRYEDDKVIITYAKKEITKEQFKEIAKKMSEDDTKDSEEIIEEEKSKDNKKSTKKENIKDEWVFR